MGDGTSADADAIAKDEELCVLEAIYGDTVNVFREDDALEIRVPHPQGGCQEVTLRVALPANYPSSCCPIAVLNGNHLSDDVLDWAVKQLESLFVPGMVVLYTWVEWLRSEELLWSVPPSPAASTAAQHQHHKQRAPNEQGEEGEGEQGQAAAASRRRAAVGATEAVREAEAWERLRSLRVTSGEPYMEKKSTFQAHVAPVSSFDHVRDVMDALLAVSKVRAATHNIMAYRIHTPPTQSPGGPGGGAGTFLQDYDDDGETAAGGRLLHLLQAADVRNVVVVVSRWFGGVLLGPSRFTAINNTARTLLEQMGLVGAGPGAGAGGKGGGTGGTGGKAAGGGKGDGHGRRGGR